MLDSVCMSFIALVGPQHLLFDQCICHMIVGSCNIRQNALYLMRSRVELAYYICTAEQTSTLVLLTFNPELFLMDVNSCISAF